MHLVKVNDQFEFQLAPAALSHLDVAEIKKDHYHLIFENRSYNIRIEDSDPSGKEITLVVNGKSFSVNIEDENDQMVRKLGLTKKSKAQSNEVKAPMPGLVLDIFAQSGAKIVKGDSLLILEAMKMENIIKATGEGIIKKIHVGKGMAVEKNQVLIELE